MLLAKAKLAPSFIVQAIVITIINYDHKTFIVEATAVYLFVMSMDK